VVCSAENDSIQKSVLSDAKFISVVSGCESDFFAVVHRWEDDRVEISAHHHSDPRQIIARAALRLSPPSQSARLEIGFDGNSSVWTFLPRAFIIYAFNTNDRRLLLIQGDEEDNFQELGWHNANYDNLYQGLVCVAEIPNRRELIITIQRDSKIFWLWQITRAISKELLQHLCRQAEAAQARLPGDHRFRDAESL
jgi:hypothetical protein